MGELAEDGWRNYMLEDVALGLALVFVDICVRLNTGVNAYTHALGNQNLTDDLSKATPVNLNEQL